MRTSSSVPYSVHALNFFEFHLLVWCCLTRFNHFKPQVDQDSSLDLLTVAQYRLYLRCIKLVVDFGTIGHSEVEFQLEVSASYLILGGTKAYGDLVGRSIVNTKLGT
jgi:hypothetical protein